MRADDYMPAFPGQPCNAARELISEYAAGLNKRELLAAMAMQGLVSHSGSIGFASGVGEIAERAVQLADGLLEELSK